ncbi:hypothetical protein HNR46_000436 [Haloferula luteola]|uniref:DUF3109 family protein n=1 Tax=Haloferula luteola TaxID=595692 RepID=A0A840UWQ5_9BACT|nr:hypothetical protein [Haloferula luteola]MBB5350212.1 hypothetical protein [Haloferula luteola]
MHPLTAYPGLEKELARQLREAELDHEVFSLPLKVCELSRCRATCCHDGALLEPEESRAIREVMTARRGLLASYGWDHPDPLTHGGGRERTVTLPAGLSELAEEFPAHFPKTRCVFLDAEHRCVLQRLAVDDGRHPWFWKPVSCWMHPLLLRPRERGGRPVLTLAQAGNDPAAGPDYPGFGSQTPCGMVCEGGPPARVTLHMELECLSVISGRDLVGELTRAAEEESWGIQR